MSPKRKSKARGAAITEILEGRWDEGQAHLANAGVELLLALRVAVSVPIDVAELRSEGSEGTDSGGAAGWRLLRELIDSAASRLRKLGDDPSRAIKRETLATVQEALAKEIERLEAGALGKDAAILAQTFRSVKAIIDRQMELLGAQSPPKGRPSRGARKVKVE
ncbi:MAG: hypothetical protein Q8R92_10990 [Deltaproteobacteria bacterium]|nr:hypothetical protein [Deltaproteobacteria bacterium]